MLCWDLFPCWCVILLTLATAAPPRYGNARGKIMRFTCKKTQKSGLRKGIIIYCVCITMSQHKIGLIYSKKKNNSKLLEKNQQKNPKHSFVSHGENTNTHQLNYEVQSHSDRTTRRVLFTIITPSFLRLLPLLLHLWCTKHYCTCRDETHLLGQTRLP